MKIIETKLSEKEFINANITLLYKKVAAWLSLAVGILMLLYAIYALVYTPSHVDISTFSVPVILIGVIPISTFFRAKKIFHNSRASEKIIYEFKDDLFLITGESFSSQLSWDKIHKVTETKNWIFIWQNSQQANPIPKKDIWEGEILKLREILDANKVKHNFK